MAPSKKHIKQKQTSKNTLPYILGSISIITFITICIVQYFLYIGTRDSSSDELEELQFNDDLHLAVKPFLGDRFSLEPLFDETPMWGTLNSGHYFGLKLASPLSVQTSLMWFVNELNEYGRLNIRHLCDQNDKLNFYSWIRHDFFSFGQQLIEDNEYKIETSYTKNPSNPIEWRAHVKVDPMGGKPNKPLSLIFYVTTDHPSDELRIESAISRVDTQEKKEIFKLRGYSSDIGNYSLSINFESEPKKFLKGNYYIGRVDKEKYPISDFLMAEMLITLHNKSRIFILPGASRSRHSEDAKVPNLIAYQLVIEASSSFTLSLNQYSSISEVHDYDATMRKNIEDFDASFDDKFPIETRGMIGSFPNETIKRLAKVSLSNMVGSVGYFFGHSLIGSSINNNKIARYGPIQLLTAVPSRSFFPRGFLWDEGFHNLLISRWNPSLSNKIISSWFNIMNVNGWIPREVILGPESMRRVPHEFIIQRLANANPPAMFIVIENMLDEGNLDSKTFEDIYPRLKRWYNWFNSTQFGPQPATFRWRGRDELSVDMLNPKTLTSGLDDYPRSSHPSPHEYHIDLRCWMALAARTLSKLAKVKGDTEYQIVISNEASILQDNTLLDDSHWSEKHRMYCDYGFDTEKTELVLVTKRRPTQQGDHLETFQVLERHSSGHTTFTCIPEFGYVSLFPMLFNILDHKSEKLGIILEKIRDENELWSAYGIRSLSKSSRYYNKYNTEHDKPYWRGAVWLNINYLILTSLKSYTKLDGPYKERCRELFIELRENLINNVLREFSRTGYTWENYDDQTGLGQGSHPFTGWSSLILLIMSSKLD